MSGSARPSLRLPALGLRSRLRSALPVLPGRDSGDAKAQVVVPEVRRAPEAVRRAAAPGVVAPAPAPVHPVRALLGAYWVGDQTRRVVAVPVRTPFPHVAVHVV